MKTSIYASLLVLSAVYAAPTFAQTAGAERVDAEVKRDVAESRRDAADEAKTRAKLGHDTTMLESTMETKQQQVPEG